MEPKFGRLITAMVTPFTEKNAVNYDEAVRLANHLVTTGTDTVLLTGTTGESPTLTHKEEFKLYDVVIKSLKGKAFVMAGTGSNCTKTAIESTQKAERIGVDGVLQVVPYYNKPPQEGLYRHFKQIAENTSLPIILYNIPGRTGINMAPETVARLSEIKNIIGIKEASGCLDHVEKVRKLVRSDFLIYSGDDALTLAFMERGACGVVSVAAHCAGKEIKKMIQLFVQGEKEAAYKIGVSLDALFEILFVTTNPAPVKAALNMMGYPVGNLRLPLVEVNEKERQGIERVLKDLRIISA